MKRIYNNGLISLCVIVLLLQLGCHKDIQIEQKEPIITEQSVLSQATDVTFKWKVDYWGFYDPSVQLSLNQDMSDAVSYGFNEPYFDESELTLIVADLKAATQYYYCYVVQNPKLNFKSEVRYFTTLNDIPEVKTMKVTEIKQYSAVVTGEVVDDNGAAVTERGMCWGKNTLPTLDEGYSHGSSGTGEGSYSVSLDGLDAGEKYYVRAYAINGNGTAYGEQLEFTTEPGLPTVQTTAITDIAWTSAVGGGIIPTSGGVAVTEKGLCWSTSHNPDITGTHTSLGGGTDSFSVTMTGLTAGTTYYVRAYAKNSLGIRYGDELSFETKNYEKPTVVTSEVTSVTQTSAVCGGDVTSEGGLSVTERGICWSTSHNPTTSGNHVTSDTGSGLFTVNITGLTSKTTYYVRAYAVNSVGTSYGDEVSFTTLLDGVINGLFSVSASQQVYFSQGNLQYKASTNTWQFAANQYDYIGNANSNISSSYSGWIDLFGWGTSGYNHGAVCYQPWSTSLANYDYHVYGQYTYNLYDQTGQADWGYNAISNGGNTTNTWRTLTKNEWEYVFNTRSTSSGIRYAKACVNNVNGVILLPDNWSNSYYNLSSTNSPDVYFTSNVISSTQWATLESHGAVFLPVTGNRSGTLVYSDGSYGLYWSASYYDSHSAFRVYFSSGGGLYPQDYDDRSIAISVRLVRPPQ